MFYDAPSSPISDQTFFSDNPMPLRYADLNKRKGLVKEDLQKNMTDFIMTFEISEVQKGLVELHDKHAIACDAFLILSMPLS